MKFTIVLSSHPRRFVLDVDLLVENKMSINFFDEQKFTKIEWKEFGLSQEKKKYTQEIVTNKFYIFENTDDLKPITKSERIGNQWFYSHFLPSERGGAEKKYEIVSIKEKIIKNYVQWMHEFKFYTHNKSLDLEVIKTELKGIGENLSTLIENCVDPWDYFLAHMAEFITQQYGGCFFVSNEKQNLVYSTGQKGALSCSKYCRYIISSDESDDSLVVLTNDSRNYHATSRQVESEKFFYYDRGAFRIIRTNENEIEGKYNHNKQCMVNKIIHHHLSARFYKKFLDSNEIEADGDSFSTFQKIEENWNRLLNHLYSVQSFFTHEDVSEEKFLLDLIDNLFSDLDNYVIKMEARDESLSCGSYKKQHLEKYVNYIEEKINHCRCFYSSPSEREKKGYYVELKSNQDTILLNVFLKLDRELYFVLLFKKIFCLLQLNQRHEAVALLEQNPNTDLKVKIMNKIERRIKSYQNNKKNFDRITKDKSCFCEWSGGAVKIIQVIEKIKKYSSMMQIEHEDKYLDLNTILVVGESGTGKELVAKSLADGIMNKNSKKNERVFLPVNCATLTKNLADSELFGHAKGAFTDAKEKKVGCIEKAQSGVLFLDEFHHLDINIQSKLLRAIETNEIFPVGSATGIIVKTKYIFGTNRPVEEIFKTFENVDREDDASENPRFLYDLLSRIGIYSIIQIPPLREREFDSITIFLDRVKKSEDISHVKWGIDPYALALIGSRNYRNRNIRSILDIFRYLYIEGKNRNVNPESLPLEMVEKNICPTVLMLMYSYLQCKDPICKFLFSENLFKTNNRGRKPLDSEEVKRRADAYFEVSEELCKANPTLEKKWGFEANLRRNAYEIYKVKGGKCNLKTYYSWFDTSAFKNDYFNSKKQQFGYLLKEGISIEEPSDDSCRSNPIE